MCVKVTQYDCEILPQLNGFVDRYFEDSDPKAEHSAEGEGAGGERGGGGGGLVGTGGGEAARQMNSPLMLVEAFLQALTNTDKDGRIVITRAGTWTLRELNMSRTLQWNLRIKDTFRTSRFVLRREVVLFQR